MEKSFYYFEEEFIWDNQSNCIAIMMNRGKGIVITDDKLVAWAGMTERRAELIAYVRGLIPSKG